MNSNNNSWPVFVALMLTGCATMEKSILLGSGVGFGVGAGVGAIATRSPTGSSPTGVLIGAALGGLVGGMIASNAYKKKDAQNKVDQVKMQELLPPQMEFTGSGKDGQPLPKLRPAQVRVRFVEDQTKDGIFIPAHLEYEIAEPARWEVGK